MIKYLSLYIISLGFFFLLSKQHERCVRCVSIDIEDTKYKIIILEDEQPKKEKKETNN